MPLHSTTLMSPSGRFKLVPPNPIDDEAVAILRCHPVTRRYLRILPERMTIDEARTLREVREKDPGFFQFHIHIVNDDDDSTTTFAGMTGLHAIDEANNNCEAGILVSPDYFGKGVATEAFYMLLQYAFEDRKFHRTGFETGTDNIPMQSWLENVAEARLESERKGYWRNVDGSYTDVKGYGILESEWTNGMRTKLEGRLKS